MKSPKIQRWIDLLVALLRHHYPITFEQLTAEVPAYAAVLKDESRRRTFERDKDELRSFGIPIETIKSAEGEIVGYRLDPRRFYLPYLTLRSEGRSTRARKVDKYGYRSLETLSFEPDELSAVTDAAARVRQLGDPLLAEHVESAMRKLACDLPVDVAAPGSTQVLQPKAKARPEILAQMGDALTRRKRVTFTYHAMGTDATSGRTVEPFGLFFLNQHWYLAGRTPEEQAVKNYRLNRIVEVEVNSAKQGTPDYEIPGGFNLRTHARSRQAWELGAGDSTTATILFRATTGAAAAAARLGEPVQGHPDRRRFQVRRLDAFARWLLSFAGDLEPLAPRELIDEYLGLVRETLAHHQTPLPSLPPLPPSR
jgi:proteasome accessory factor B